MCTHRGRDLPGSPAVTSDAPGPRESLLNMDDAVEKSMAAGYPGNDMEAERRSPDRRTPNRLPDDPQCAGCAQRVARVTLRTSFVVYYRCDTCGDIWNAASAEANLTVTQTACLGLIPGMATDETRVQLEIEAKVLATYQLDLLAQVEAPVRAVHRGGGLRVTEPGRHAHALDTQ